MNVYKGTCVGGPWNGRGLASEYRIHNVAMMDGPPRLHRLGDPIKAHIKYGTYEFDEENDKWMWGEPE